MSSADAASLPPVSTFMAPERLLDPRVAVVRTSADYADSAQLFGEALRSLGDTLGWSRPDAGAFGELVRAGDRVVVKPNWVLHRNVGGGGFEPLVTHADLLLAVITELQRSSASQITLGDAPVQGCDFRALLDATGIEGKLSALQRTDDRLRGPIDFRRTVSSFDGGVRQAHEELRSLDDYVLFDLGADSYLEPVTTSEGKFRVTMYPPQLMHRTHARGRHQYLVAREFIEANVVVNAPKLKTHKKAGVTCALKNLVGINGNKEYLPHHRLGSPAVDGDCYPHEGVAQEAVKRTLERVLDIQNSTRRSAAQVALSGVTRVLYGISHRLGDTTGVEGAWSGNDTVWRMCLDLNRILLYGRLDGTIATEPQRRVVNVVDAVVAGQGDGPLAPEPLPLGVVYGGASSAAVDWVGSLMLGYDPMKIPITRGAFLPGTWPLVRFAPDAISVLEGGRSTNVAHCALRPPTGITYPAGWADAVG